MNYPKYDCYKPKPHYCKMDDDDDQDDCEKPCMKKNPEHDCYSTMCSDMDKMKCKTEKECVKTYKTYYKLYRVCQYRLYKLCPCCGHEFDYHRHRGMCPKCGVSI